MLARILLLGGLTACALAIVPSFGATSARTYTLNDYAQVGGRPKDTDAAIQAPGVFAWKLFLNVCRPGYGVTSGKRGVAVPGKKFGDPGPCVFESWKNPGELFLAPGSYPGNFDSPPPHGFKPLTIPKPALLLGLQQGYTLGQLKKMMASSLGRNTIARLTATSGAKVEEKSIAAMNRSTFDFIRSSKLYTKKKLADRYASGLVVEFPRASMETKAYWVPIAAGQACRYHTSTFDGNLYGLASLHIITKDVPNWFWCTFEHEDNPKPLSPDDVFPEISPSNNNQFVLTGRLKSALPRMLLKTVFRHYRLRAAQTDFYRADGKAVSISNTLLEERTTHPSSCMSCHARAAVDAMGMMSGGFGIEPAPDSQPQAKGPLGHPNPSIFGKGKLKQVDFVFSFIEAQ